METMVASASIPFPREPANYDEASMHHTLLFSDSLKDLKNLRKQLYSAAEYFEYSYTNDDQKQIVVDTLKDYAIKALVNTVDHLGSVTYKVTDLLDEKVDEVSGTDLRVSCIEQRLRSCQEYIDNEGLSQQSLVINTPKYHKRYVLPGNYILLGRPCKVPTSRSQNIKDVAKIIEMTGMNLRMVACLLRYLFTFFGVIFPFVYHKCSQKFMCSILRCSSYNYGNAISSSQKRALSITFSASFPANRNVFVHKYHAQKGTSVYLFSYLSMAMQINQRSDQHHHIVFHFYVLDLSLVDPPLQIQERQPQIQAGRQPQTPLEDDGFVSFDYVSCVPNAWVTRPVYQHPEPQKSASMRLPAERDHRKEPDQLPSKSKRLLKALLSRRKSKKDDMLYTYLDEY
ncbi:hypothetical protein RJ639_032669 [Escallonia herrerae]|uniref:Protein ABIL2 n=1 Tax=Escallonia herrerae TaxID=1293975 RepID=A0AA88WV39_9ASTE|nr:hypothetical protein RJ639_032669 [Escallonia herrerae]